MRWKKRNGFREAELVIVPSCSPTRFPHPAPHLETAHHQPFGLHVDESKQMRCEWLKYSTDDGTRHLRGRRRLGLCGMVKRDKDEEDWVTSSRTGAAISAHPIGHLVSCIVWSYLIGPISHSHKSTITRNLIFIRQKASHFCNSPFTNSPSTNSARQRGISQRRTVATALSGEG